MKTNESILDQYKEDEYDTYFSRVCCLEVAKKAQVEALKELVKRTHLHNPFSDKYKTTSEIVLEMIKEIENG